MEPLSVFQEGGAWQASGQTSTVSCFATSATSFLFQCYYRKGSVRVNRKPEGALQLLDVDRGQYGQLSRPTLFPIKQKQQKVSSDKFKFRGMQKNVDYRPWLICSSLRAEGTTTNGRYLLPFKTGAFLAGTPVKPYYLHFPNRRFNPAWETISGVRLV